jgi:hypothetical protein
VVSLDKADFVLWSRKYDKSMGWRLNREQELGARFRRNKILTLDDLALVVEWKFWDAPEKKKRVLELVARNDPAKVERISSQVFSLPNADDVYRMNCLLTLEGVSPVLASIILSFFDPKQYGFLDVSVWKYFLGNVPTNVLSPSNYIKLLAILRKTAAKHNLDVRVIDKALYKKSLEEAKPDKKTKLPKTK